MLSALQGASILADTNIDKNMSGEGCCSKTGPGYATPMDAFKNSKKEKLLYLPCIIPAKDRPDYIVTIDVDENSKDFGKVNAFYTFKWK